MFFLLVNVYKVRLDVFKEIESFLLENIKFLESGVRFCSVFWVIWLYFFLYVFSCFICMLGVGDVKFDIWEMVNEGLRVLNVEKEGVEGFVFIVEYLGLRFMMEYIC